MTERRAATRMRMFDDIERMDARAWAQYLAPDAVMRLGNDAPIYGRDRCRAAVEAFYARIDGLRYDLVELWEHGEATIVEANVTYTRPDGEEVTLPVVTIYRTDANDLISDYRVYTDSAPVFAGLPAAA
ncbi:MAG TPA: nuclear transport factor 2 family protein [Solirubrobacteraceae bacterium]|nr:nuclear transport factor 2 family protein [Solirubrobacteraceae bacterium]